MVTMAIDASSKSTGIAIFKDKDLIHYECITAGSTNPYKRIKKMVQEISNLYQKYQVTNVIMEDVIPEDVRHNQQVFKILHYLQAAIVLELDNYNQKIEFFVSSEWRKRCGIKTGRTGTRETLKAAAQKLVKDNYGIVANDDICDSICIGWTYTHDTSESFVTPGGFEFK